VFWRRRDPDRLDVQTETLAGAIVDWERSERIPPASPDAAWLILLTRRPHEFPTGAIDRPPLQRNARNVRHVTQDDEESTMKR